MKVKCFHERVAVFFCFFYLFFICLSKGRPLASSFGGLSQTKTDQPIDNSYLFITLHSPGELLITDPQGRRTGRDPINGIDFQEIPESSYYQEYEEDAETGETVGDDIKMLDIGQPLDGDYKLQVIGTGSGTYNMDIRGSDISTGPPSGKDFIMIPITPNIVHIYGFKYQKAIGSQLQFTALDGNFDGKGQRPSGVNKFISYVTPTQGRTTLARGTIIPPLVNDPKRTIFRLVLIYDKAIISSTFSAVMNGKDIKSLFHPAPGHAETVWLELDPGSNTLVISVDGNLENRAATDTDRLVFIVQ